MMMKMMMLRMVNMMKLMKRDDMCDELDCPYPIHSSGVSLQSVLQRNRSHESQPMGGVLARPLSRDWTLVRHNASSRVVTQDHMETIL